MYEKGSCFIAKPFLFHCKTTTKGQFQLQIIILRNGTGASF